MQVSWFLPGKILKYPWQKEYNYNRIIASTWIRCLQLISSFLKHDIKVSLNKYNKETKIAIFLRRWNEKDRLLAKKLKDQGIKIVLDTPVNYFSDAELPAYKGEVKTDFLKFAELADAIICPSEYTKTFGEKKGYKTFCIEDSINLEHFRYKKKTFSQNKTSLIWSGIDVKADVLNFLSDEVIKNKWDFIIISNKKPNLNFSYKFIKWNYYSLPQDILEGDIAVFPRQANNEYDLGHSFYKIAPFVVANIPIIYSPIPSYEKIVSTSSIKLDDLNASVWSDSIERMKNNLDKNYSNTSISKYSTENIVLKYRKLFKDCFGL